MILNLSVKNFLIVESVYIDFTDGVSALNNKKAAEKSLILDAILLCFGYNLNGYDYIQQGKNSCTLTSEVDTSKVPSLKQIFEDNGIEHDDTIIIKRYQKIDKKASFFINDQQVTHHMIKEITSKLLENCTFGIDFSNPTNHADILDRYGKLEIYKQEINKLYNQWQDGILKLESLTLSEKSIQEEIEYLESAINDLSQAGVRPNEEKVLLEEIKELQKTISNQKLIKSALKHLSQVDLNESFAQVSKILGQEESLTSSLNHLEQSLINLDACKKILQNKVYESSLEHQIFEIEERLFEIRTLARKHQVDVNCLHLFFQESLLKLQKLRKYTQEKNEQSSYNNELFIKYQKQASFLNQKRQKTAKDLEQYVGQIASNEIFKINIEAIPKKLDNVQFVLLDLDMKNDIVASIKLALTEKANQPTILFKQEQTSKNIENFIKKQLSVLSINHQIICI
ncbi:Putative DNA repair protein RecN [Candidatus Phycorickettsia trachydisci]|uniref:DNA repair protein RecN n=1 Tax=Candidatus Phycorickettsia trachydisci TaxID=2115978 RepID=A0A2P1P8E9_9RICK|nr:hypothetical protein [Candidatus Phycorickettsia trachydisci]AVP87534.1 Putative DNA repair protein RecN [Candidatus Phycorickettsia trachydisci]